MCQVMTSNASATHTSFVYDCGAAARITPSSIKGGGPQYLDTVNKSRCARPPTRAPSHLMGTRSATRSMPHMEGWRGAPSALGVGLFKPCMLDSFVRHACLGLFKPCMLGSFVRHACLGLFKPSMLGVFRAACMLGSL